MSDFQEGVRLFSGQQRSKPRVGVLAFKSKKYQLTGVCLERLKQQNKQHFTRAEDEAQ